MAPYLMAWDRQEKPKPVAGIFGMSYQMRLWRGLAIMRREMLKLF